MEKKGVAFNGTKEQEKKLLAVIEQHKGQAGAAIPVLHEAQEIYGYLPIEVQQMIAEGLGISLADIYGIVTFYARFTLNPKGSYNLAVCLGLCKDVVEIIAYLTQDLLEFVENFKRLVIHA